MKTKQRKTQITEQANGKFSLYTDHGVSWSMADETLLAFDLTLEQAEREIKLGASQWLST